MCNITYDAGILYSNKVFTTDFTLNKYGDYQIFSYYLQKSFTINSNFSSPFREDNHPSFSIFQATNGRLLFKDLKYGTTGNAIKFVRQLFPYLKSTKEAIIKIHIDLNRNKLQTKSYIDKNNQITMKKQSKVGINRGKFIHSDLQYWGKYNISKDILKFFEVYVANCVFIDNNIVWTYEEENPIFAYKIFNHFKIYRPLTKDKRKKWLGNCNRYDIAGYNQLPNEGELLIITKSLKDVMCLYAFGYTAIAPATETISIPVSVIKDIKKRFKTIYLFYDNDNAGYINAQKLAIKYNIPTIYIPIETSAKDITDYVDLYGEIKTKELLNNLLSETKNNESNSK